MRAMPDMTVLAPADETELLAMMDWAAAYHGPVYLRLARDGVPDLFDAGYAFSPGAVHQLRRGGDVALVSTGPQTSRVLQAADQLRGAGTSATVVHVPSLKPLDAAALVAEIGTVPQVVTVEEHSVHGGLGGLVAEVLTGAGNSPRIERIGLDDVWGESADNDFLLDKHGLSPSRIADRVRNLLPAGSPA
jgi:transketolase